MSQPGPTPEVRLTEAESGAGRAPVPLWLIILFSVLLFGVMLYLDRHAGRFHPLVYAPYRNLNQVRQAQPAGGAERMLAQGKAVYDRACGLCHQANGLGVAGQFPPLVGSEWVTGSPGRLIRIPLHGLSGPIVVNGVTWNLAMPAMGAGLSDVELAAALTYIRQSWGNNASVITPEQVRAVREQTAGRTRPWTAAELQPIAD